MIENAQAHAARMDAIYKRQRAIYNITRKYYLLGRDRLIAKLAVPKGGTVLEIGCGTGRNLIKVAQRYPHAQLYGLDISEAMLETARVAVAKAGLSAQITLAQGDATDFNPATLFGHSHFDCVYFSYTLSMIPDWRAALAMAGRVIANSGALHIVDFGQQEHLPAMFKALLWRWLRKFDVNPIVHLLQAAADLSQQLSAQNEYIFLFRGYACALRISRS